MIEAAEKPRVVNVAAAARRPAPRVDGQHLQAAFRAGEASEVPHRQADRCRGPGSTRSIALLGSVGVHSLPIVLGGFMGNAATSGLSTSAGWATMVRLTRQCSGSPSATADRQTR